MRQEPHLGADQKASNQNHPVNVIELGRQLLHHQRDPIRALHRLGGKLLKASVFGLTRSSIWRVPKQKPNISAAFFGQGQCQDVSGDNEAA